MIEKNKNINPYKSGYMDMIKEISLMALCILLAVAGLFYIFCGAQSIALLILTKVIGAGMLFAAYRIDKNYKPSKQD